MNMFHSVIPAPCHSRGSGNPRGKLQQGIQNVLKVLDSCSLIAVRDKFHRNDRLKIFICLFVLALPSPALAVDRVVSNFADSGNGTLRRVIQGACQSAGDDTIRFASLRFPQVVIPLRSPLVIPANCNGRVIILAPWDQEVILDGGWINDPRGMVQIHSGKNHLEALTFTGYTIGPALRIDGDENTIRVNSFGIERDTDDINPNGTGIQIVGNKNVVTGNTITANKDDGFVITGHNNVIQSNFIGLKPGLCIDDPPTPPSEPEFIREILHQDSFIGPSPVTPFEIQTFEPKCGNEGAGIRISGDASDNLIGGFSSGWFSNFVRSNRMGGIILDGTAASLGNQIAQNVIYKNGGLGIDLGGDGVTLNDNGDRDTGPNGFLNTPETLEVSPIDTEPVNGEYHYTLRGEGLIGATLYLYLVSDDEALDTTGFGEGQEFVLATEVTDDPFEVEIGGTELAVGRWITTYLCDPDGNCSEFSRNVRLSRDVDNDSIPDFQEDHDADNRRGAMETDWLSKDTDGDGLPDNIEDRNRNGLSDQGELEGFHPDTDDDGISDFIETGGDGVYEIAVGDTNPFDSDTDHDGIPDGQEDINKDGLWDIGERDPRK